MNAHIAANLQLAIKVLETKTSAQTDLGSFQGIPNQCGTPHCAAGWLAQEPHFQELGMALGQNPGTRTRSSIYPAFRMIVIDTKPELSPAPESFAQRFDFLDRIFGDEAFDRLFACYGDGSNDQDIVGDGVDLYERNENSKTDKDLALARLRRQLAIYA